MSRIQSCLIVIAACSLLGAFAPLAKPDAPATEVLTVAEKDSNYRKSCLKLRRCRAAYTWCFNKIEKNPKRDQWSAMRTVCVDKYKACIKKNFAAGELMFERWFVKEVDCG